jgi:hypothetical protein
VLCVLLLVLLVIVAVGLLGLASIELRRGTAEDGLAQARANARLALMQAIGQLQRTMGPDQRVSATAEILPGEVEQPHWTGVWRATLEDGTSFFTRDDLTGGLRDERWERRNEENLVAPMEWLVSGQADPSSPGGSKIALFHQGGKPVVEVPKLGVKGKSGAVAGHFAWWTGDLGVRANLATEDPREDIPASRKDPGNGGLFRVMASPAADAAMMQGGAEMDNWRRARLASEGTVALAGMEEGWVGEHAFDFTVHSRGVLADVAEGGLKRDLTVFFEKGEVADFHNLKGLTDAEPLVGDADDPASRYRRAGPSFGLLRDWARLAVPFSGDGVGARLPETDAAAGRTSAHLALANERPVKLAGNRRSALLPILVEATNFTQMSCYQTRETPMKMYQLRQLMYPRVVLWNPYNCELNFERSIIMIQGNGRQEMWTANQNVNALPWWSFRNTSQWLSFEGGRSTNFRAEGGIMNSEGYNDPYMGSYYFSIPATRFGPGECLVFSPARAAEYDGLSAYRPGSYNLAANELSCEVAPDPGRAFFVSATDIGGGINFLPKEFWYAKTEYWSLAGRSGVENQGDDTRAILKHLGDAGTVTYEDFDKLPQLSVLSASLQYGAGREPRLVWNVHERMPIELLDKDSPQPTVIPNVRTRESIRLRWFDEHPSNLINSGKLSGTPHFEEALLANWNPRAAFIVRSPWENIAGTLPLSGGGGGPWFFGAYTRDLFDQAVSWDEQMPVPRSGRYHGNPFGPPQEGNRRYVLFDVPRRETGLLSLGQLQHAKLSDMVWHPAYAVGNSLVDPRLGKGGLQGLHRTAALAADPEAVRVGGFHESELGWSDDRQRSEGKDAWAVKARAILGDVPASDHLVYDLSFEVNQKLWDRYYLSSGSQEEKGEFLKNPRENPLPNSRHRLVDRPLDEDLADFHRSAYHLMVDGAFNVNSTRVEAWKALLGSTRLSGYGADGQVPFPRVIDPPAGAWTSDDEADGDEVWAGYRELSPEEIGRLAEAIVAEVKLRGPFVSMADFVNRRLAEDESGRMGALQAAIEKAGLNSVLSEAYPLNNEESLPDYRHPDRIPDSTRMEQTLKPASKAWGAPAYLTQADLLQALGPVLTVRSDSFVIRAYGDSVDPQGKLRARVWCEAVVQRMPRPLEPDESGLNPRRAGAARDFGRHFAIRSFRWLSPDEI